jgi:hypothetical protein
MDLNYSYAATAGSSGAATTAGNSGQLMAITSSPASTINGQARNQTFTYDDLGRLVTATGWATWQRRFDYDRWGNRTGVWDATSGGLQIQSVTLQQQPGAPAGVPSNRSTTITNGGTGLTQTYDAAGNLIGDGVHTYQYDGENRIARVDAGTSNEADYFYDANNCRVKKTTSNNTYTTYCIWEGGQVIAEYSNARPVGPGTVTTSQTGYRIVWSPIQTERSKERRIICRLERKAARADQVRSIVLPGVSRVNMKGWITSLRGTTQARRGGLPVLMLCS